MSRNDEAEVEILGETVSGGSWVEGGRGGLILLSSDLVKRDPIIDQFSIITRPYPIPNDLKTIPFPVAHTRIANIWLYPPPRNNMASV